jgi:tryptophan-rich sensory protein
MPDPDDIVVVSVVELFISIIAVVYLIGFLPGMISRSTRQVKMYNEIRTNVRLAPPSWLFGVVWFLLYSLMAIAAYIVRLNGGMYVSGVNLQSLIYFWVLQIVLAFYTILFFGMNQRVWAMLIVFTGLLLSIIVGVLFWPVSVVSAVFMFTVSAWLLFAFILSILILRASASKSGGSAIEYLTYRRKSTSSVEEGSAVESMDSSIDQRTKRTARSKSTSGLRR